MKRYLPDTLSYQELCAFLPENNGWYFMKIVMCVYIAGGRSPRGTGPQYVRWFFIQRRLLYHQEEGGWTWYRGDKTEGTGMFFIGVGYTVFTSISTVSFCHDCFSKQERHRDHFSIVIDVVAVNNIKSVHLGLFLKHQDLGEWDFIHTSAMMHPGHCTGKQGRPRYLLICPKTGHHGKQSRPRYLLICPKTDQHGKQSRPRNLLICPKTGQHRKQNRPRYLLICPKTGQHDKQSSPRYVLICPKTGQHGKQSRPRSVADSPSVWSGSTLFA